MIDVRDSISRLFELPTVLNMWPTIQKTYTMLGFKDVLTDEKMISEYKYIVEQFRKYVSSHEKQILKCENIEAMLIAVEKMIKNAPEVDLDRKVLVYYQIRDSWLWNLYTYIKRIELGENLGTPTYLKNDEEDE